MVHVFLVLVSLLPHLAPAWMQESFPQSQLHPEQVKAHPAHAQALTTPDISIARGQVLFFQEQRATKPKTPEVNGEICHLSRPHSPVEEEDRSLLLFLLSLFDRSFRLLTKCCLALVLIWQRASPISLIYSCTPN